MNKQIRKTIEAELYSLIKATLSIRNKKAASAISTNIKESAKNLAKKFIKNTPKSEVKKATKKGSKIAGINASVSRQATAVKKTATRAKRAAIKKLPS